MLKQTYLEYQLCFKFGIINFARTKQIWPLMYFRRGDWVSNWANEAKIPRIPQCICLVPSLTKLYRLRKVYYVM